MVDVATAAFISVGTRPLYSAAMPVASREGGGGGEAVGVVAAAKLWWPKGGSGCSCG